MARPSMGTDRKLIEAARHLLPETGISGLALRRVAAQAGVTLGMFHYHFKSKEDFIRRVLGEFYDEFFGELEAEFKKRADAGDSLETLRGLLRILGRFALANRATLASIFRDLLAGERLALEFAIKNAPRHLSLLHETITRAQAAQAIRDDVSAEQLTVHALSSMVVSTVALAAFAGGPVAKTNTKQEAKPKTKTKAQIGGKDHSDVVDLIEGLLARFSAAPGGVERQVELVMRGMIP